jgi:sterol desaturase/sphingolipid hydroxylase (fatty acid hydroxylase superfamily)
LAIVTTTRVPAARARRTRQTRKITDLRTALDEFLRHRSPQLLLAELPLVIAIRVLWGHFGWIDVAILAGIVALQPFTEWLLHVYVLHVQPRGPVTNALDWAAGKSHRRHHRDPEDLAWQFIHPHAVLGGFAANLVLLALGPHTATYSVGAVLMTLVYEWTHYLIHTDVRPQSRPYKALWRHHRLHHFRNENYWFGVTGRLGDRVLHTLPEKNDVPVSPTARTAAAARTS